MRKIKLQMQVSIDGFVAGRNGEMDWMVWDWDVALLQSVAEKSTLKLVHAKSFDCGIAVLCYELA